MMKLSVALAALIILSGCTQPELLVCDQDRAFEKIGTVEDDCLTVPIMPTPREPEDPVTPESRPEPRPEPHEPEDPITPEGKSVNPNKSLNSGRGNGDECGSGNCDPGNSGGKNKGGDEV